jgi:hypothetical protein
MRILFTYNHTSFDKNNRDCNGTGIFCIDKVRDRLSINVSISKIFRFFLKISNAKVTPAELI